MYFLVAYKYNNYFTEKAYICKLYMYARARMDRIEAQKRILELKAVLKENSRKYYVRGLS